MNIIERIVRSWWVLISFIILINGFGLIYIGFKTNNRKWVLEGAIYEIPWIFTIAFIAMPHVVFSSVLALALFLMLIGIIRSVWVDVKYLNMREVAYLN